MDRGRGGHEKNSISSCQPHFPISNLNFLKRCQWNSHWVGGHRLLATPLSTHTLHWVAYDACSALINHPHGTRSLLVSLLLLWLADVALSGNICCPV